MSLYTTKHSSFEVLPPDAPRSAQIDAARALNLPSYVVKKALCVLVGGLEVVVVGILHVDAGALLKYAE